MSPATRFFIGALFGAVAVSATGSLLVVLFPPTVTFHAYFIIAYAAVVTGLASVIGGLKNE